LTGSLTGSLTSGNIRSQIEIGHGGLPIVHGVRPNVGLAVEVCDRIARSAQLESIQFESIQFESIQLESIQLASLQPCPIRMICQNYLLEPFGSLDS
jgi:hypothetical protein